jgi:hypothetical protein
MVDMIPFMARAAAFAAVLIAPAWSQTGPASSQTGPAAPATAGCLESGDGYFRARVATIDWPNSGTVCQGEARNDPPGVRLSFHRALHARPDLLFVLGLTGVRAGQPAHEVGANLTVIVQGTPRIFGTMGDSRCTVDSLKQTPLKSSGAYRLEARGFCTQPAHAVRGSGSVLVNTFEFAGIVRYDEDPSPLAAGLGRPQLDLEQARPILARDE